MKDNLQILMNFKKCIVDEWEELSIKKSLKNYINLGLRKWLIVLDIKQLSNFFLSCSIFHKVCRHFMR